MALPPLSLYVHIPWCVRKCPYCDFNSHGLKGALPENAYVEALLKDLDQDLPRVRGREIQTIFFGGGTPSLFSAVSIEHFLRALRERLPVVPEAEVTLEANPGTVESGRFASYRQVGVNRLSIGVQSFDAVKLEVLGRIHTSAEARHAAAEARSAGIGNFNLDLMYALPRQSLAEARHDVLEALQLDPTHLSHYQLTLEPNTLFHAHPPVLPDDDAAWEMQVECQTRLQEHGYIQYEVSAYAKPGHECRHNLNYWRFGDYLGVGAGAHGKLTDLDGHVTRLWKLKHPEAYLSSAGTPQGLGGVDPVEGADLIFEFMLNRLRLTARFGAREFEAATGLSSTVLERPIHKALSLKLLEEVPGGWQTTQRGRACLNDLQSLFLPAEGASRKVSA